MSIPVYCLVCSELPQRTDACKRHFVEMGISVNFWRGVHGRTWGLRTVHEYDPGQTLPPGHVGLNIGTWFLWQHVYQSTLHLLDEQPFLFFEDDVRFPGDWESQLRSILGELDRDFPDWDLVFIGSCEQSPQVWNKVTERIGPPDSRLCRLVDPFGTHALMIRRRALPILLDRMAIAHRNLDQQLWERVLKPGLLKWCAVLPSIVEQRTFDYTGTGVPEWAPSCVDRSDPAPLPVPSKIEIPASPPSESPETGIKLHLTEARRMAGGQGIPTDLPGRPTPELIRASSSLIDRLPCLYRAEPLEDDGITSFGRAIPVTQCARLNKPCHDRNPQSTGRVRMPDREEVVSCETCKYRMEISTDIERDKLPLPVSHFNPSMLMYRGRLVFATRDSWGHSKVALWEMQNSSPDWTGKWTTKAIGSYASEHQDAPRLEDPRLFLSKDPITGNVNLCSAFNLPDGYPPKRVQVGYCRFTPDLDGIIETKVFRSPTKSIYEKNWSAFEDENGLNWIYSMKPDHVVMSERSVYTSTNPYPWTGGVMRGGACPVRVGDEYYTFFHGCLKRISGNIYTVGCYTFESKPPYRILRQTAVPLLWPDAPGKDENVVKRFVCWVGGAVLHANAWHLAIGVDDTFCKIVRIPCDVVESALLDKPETDRDRVTSIRSTSIATGIPELEKRV